MGQKTIDELVRADEGLVSRSIFVDEEIFQQELKQIFSRAWLFVGHESLVPKPDDYFVSRMGTESVILTRDRQGQIQVMLNSCAHRGMKLCRYDHGNNRTFTCPYHGWSFSTDGKLVERPGELVGVPGHATHYKGELDKKQWGLKTVAQVVNYKGAIWATWDPNAPPFLDYIGNMRLYLDAALDHRNGSPGGSEVIGGVQKWRVKCNWKFAPENFIGDLYHDISHRSVDIVGIGPGGGKGRRDASATRSAICFPELGHGLLGRLPFYEEGPYAPQYARYPEVEAYYREIHEHRERTLGSAMRVQTSVGTIFPNMSFHGRQPRTLAVFHPISSTEMEMWRMYLVDKDAPEAVKEAARHYFLRYSGPGGMTESDDMENWTGATEASMGAMSRELYFNYQMGVGHRQDVPEIAGCAVNGEYTEENARIYYRRWAQFMNGLSWDQLMAGAVRLEEAA
ncbi:aromatic ring-hydroxylating dioxygenase subunit alpha [Achromobacter mucicolens]|uniref:aromatic ring-hydroxylating oxygenase subunit alpha n=1 Tax=Achromobacter mucicolens TaxID=1389922 RepID=UPI000D451C21|nr:Rieske 2Fe-2S domain-containing protein [Achromobacter mucicolens]MCP2517792.1 Rieske 2Fe-2S domain-containing protein [Achromobacter mucicolens]PTW88881.1 aromatic ring-hydroxylating dioxygenase subunit alpha [Achromobacter mucicolens]